MPAALPVRHAHIHSVGILQGGVLIHRPDNQLKHLVASQVIALEEIDDALGLADPAPAGMYRYHPSRPEITLYAHDVSYRESCVYRHPTLYNTTAYTYVGSYRKGGRWWLCGD